MPAESHGHSGPRASTVPAGGPPPQVTMGLLPYLTAHALDEDYVHVSERDAATRDRREPQAGVAALLVLGLFGLLVATAAVQTSRNAVSNEDEREGLITQIQARTAQVENRRDELVRLRAEVGNLENLSLETTARGRAISSRLNRLGVISGATAVTGPGVRVIVDDAPNATTEKEEVLDRDLQRLVNGLWLSGAEAISINGQRITNLSAIRHAGTAITVNYESLSRPYVVSAIGDPDSLPARFVETRDGAEWADLVREFHLRFDMTSEESLTLPAADRASLRYAHRPEDDR